jgi:hypothetical protein
MSDEELDDLVRRSAEAYPEEIPLGGWSRMEDRLQEAATNRLVRQKVTRLFMYEVAIVGLLLLLWQGYRTLNPSAQVTQQPTRTTLTADNADNKATAATTPTTSAQPSASLKPSVSTPPLVPMLPKGFASTAVNKPASVSANELAVSSARNTVAARRRTGAASSSFIATLTPPKRQSLAAAGETQFGAVARSTSSLRTETEGLDSPQQINNARAETGLLLSDGLAIAPTATPSAPQQTELEQQPTVPSAVLAATSAKDTLAQKPATPTPVPDSTEKKRPERPRPPHRLVVGIMLAPSFSAVRRLETARFGNDLGVTLEYRLTSRLRVRTSIIRSVKQYGVASTDYILPDSWGWRQGDYDVNAACRMTEIPVNLRYDVMSRPTYAVFASVGLSSMLMRYECYDYDFEVGGQTQTKVQKVYNGSNHPFGLLNLSGGMERTLGGRWSVQAEPFLQLPLGGVGAGKVRLASAGTAFSVKYGLSR